MAYTKFITIAILGALFPAVHAGVIDRRAGVLHEFKNMWLT